MTAQGKFSTWGRKPLTFLYDSSLFTLIIFSLYTTILTFEKAVSKTT